MGIKYKVHTGYITMNGEVIFPGIYDEEVLDLAEARRKSHITQVDATVETKVEEKPIVSYETKKFETVIKNDKGEVVKDNRIREINLEPTITNTTLDTLKINSALFNDIASIKYVSRKVANNVTSERDKAPFKSYIDLNERVSLPFNRKWEDIAVIDFELEKAPKPHLIEYSTGL